MKIKISEHARLDSFPLRYGYVPDEYLEMSSETEDVNATNNQKPREIRNGNKHYICKLWTLSGEDLGKARIVLSPATSADPFPKVVTALSVEPIPADRAVSEIIQLKRRRGEISTEFTISTLHPLYRQRKLSSPEALIDIFVDLGVADAEKRVDLLQKLLAEASEESEALARNNEELVRRNRELEERILEQEVSKPSYRNEGIAVSVIATLKHVETRPRTNSKGKTVNCTYLEFEEPGLPLRKMDETFDPNGVITQKAMRLIGRRVRTSTWRPEIFGPLDWFRDVYPVD